MLFYWEVGFFLLVVAFSSNLHVFFLDKYLFGWLYVRSQRKNVEIQQKETKRVIILFFKLFDKLITK